MVGDAAADPAGANRSSSSSSRNGGGLSLACAIIAASGLPNAVGPPRPAPNCVAGFAPRSFLDFLEASLALCQRR
eukprot:2293053-Pyramimonas_sp.AAC.1